MLQLGKYLIGRACRRLPDDTRQECYLEWTGELPAILNDTDRCVLRRVIYMLSFAVDQSRTTRRLAPLSTARGRTTRNRKRPMRERSVTPVEGAAGPPWAFLGISLVGATPAGLVFIIHPNDPIPTLLTFLAALSLAVSALGFVLAGLLMAMSSWQRRGSGPSGVMTEDYVAKVTNSVTVIVRGGSAATRVTATNCTGSATMQQPEGDR